MTANELADALQETEPYYPTDYKLFDQAATMLRQQQAEIEALKAKKLNDLYVDGEIAGWIGYQEGHLVSFLQNQKQVDSFLKNTDPTGQVRPVYTSPRIKP